MAKQGEKSYFDNIGEQGRQHAANKPFSDSNCGGYLIDIGQLMKLLPKPPAKLLDIGCGTGWTSKLFARTGYSVIGIDISSTGIELAKKYNYHPNISFIEGDFEEMNWDLEFDCIVSYDTLHHAENEHLTIECVFKALKAGGAFISMEPGTGHADAEGSIRARREFGVIEKDMPPRHIMELLRKSGFKDIRIIQRLSQLPSIDCQIAISPNAEASNCVIARK